MLMLLWVAALCLRGAEPGPIAVESLTIQAAALATLPAATIKVESGGRTVTYTGVALASILESRAKPVAGMAGLRDLADAVLLIRGADGYQAAVSAAAVAMDPKGERYLLATSRDGQAMPPQVIIPGDPRHARWVKEVVAIRLVRLHDLAPQP